MSYEEIVRAANREAELEWLDVQERIRLERAAAYEEQKPSPADLIADEWREIDRTRSDGWQLGGGDISDMRDFRE